MAVASPMLQVDSLDSFPVCSDDFELLLMFCLCLVGMMLVFAHVVKLLPFLFRAVVPLVPSIKLASLPIAGESSNLLFPPAAPLPLRI